MKIFIFKEVIIGGKLVIHFHLPLKENVRDFRIVTDSEYTLENSEEYMFFGEEAKEFPGHFYTLTFDIKPSKVRFEYYNIENEEYRGIRIQAKNLSMYRNYRKFERILGTDILTFKTSSELIFMRTKHAFVEEELYGELKPLVEKDVYLFHDRRNKADDNAEALYRYYMQEEPIFFDNNDLYYVIEEGCPDWFRLKADGFKLVGLNSQFHKVLYTHATAILTANALPRTFNPYGDTYVSNTNAAIIALNHGVISNDFGSSLNRNSRRNELSCAVGKYDYELISSFSGYPNLQITGLARFDNYQSIEDEKYIMYFPTWNKKYARNLYNSKFYKEIINFICDEKINNILIANNIKLKVLFHPLLAEAILKNEKVFAKVSDQIEFLDVFESSFKQLLGSNSLLITDSSSVRYDNFYQRKNAICYAPYDKNNGESQYDESKMFTNVDTLDELRIALETIIYNDFAVSDEVAAAADDFFETMPGENCKNIVEQVKKVIARRKDEL